MDFENFLPHSSLYNRLRTLINHLLNHNVGTLADGQFEDVCINVCDFATGRPCIDYCSPSSSGNKDVCDRFKLRIPYCGKHIIWEVVFNSLSPEDPPDFNLNDENLTSLIDPDILDEFVPSLVDWKYDDPSSLTNVIKEFISFHKKYQFEQLKKDNFCSIEYESILKTGLIDEKDVEVFVTNNGLVYFLIRLCPDLTDYRVGHSRDHYAGHIAVCFNTNAGNKMTKPQVKFTTVLKDYLMPKPGSNDSIESATLAEFLVKLNEKIEELLSPAFLKPVAKRKRFIFEWCSYLGRKVIEFDAIRFHDVSFLLEQDGFTFILRIKLSKDFTAVPPDYRFQSTYSQNTLIIPIEGIPYNPNWPFKVMMTKAINFIGTKIPMFRKICIDNI